MCVFVCVCVCVSSDSYASGWVPLPAASVNKGGCWEEKLLALSAGHTFPCTSPEPRPQSVSGWSASLLYKHHLCITKGWREQVDGKIDNDLNKPAGRRYLNTESLYNSKTIFTAPEHCDTSHPGAAVLANMFLSWAAGPTCCHQDAALGIHNPLTQRLRGETCKLNRQKERREQSWKMKLLQQLWPLKGHSGLLQLRSYCHSFVHHFHWRWQHYTTLIWDHDNMTHNQVQQGKKHNRL